MHHSKFIFIFFRILIIIFLFNSCKEKQNKNYHFGAYYFDGWSGTYPEHLTQLLKDSFPEREPKWGWKTSTQTIIDSQILEANKVGITFFNFCWYLNKNKKYKEEPLNNALYFYKKSKYRNKIQHCLLVANHKDFEIEKSDWDMVCNAWIELFKDENYLRINEKPIIFFFSQYYFLKNFGSPEEIKKHLTVLKEKAKAAGLNGVEIAICTSTLEIDIKTAEACGFDILSGYNYFYVGLQKNENRKVPIETLQKEEIKTWDLISQKTRKPYIPLITLNWDPRPWTNKNNKFDSSPYYVGFSLNSVNNSIKNCITWMNKNEEEITKEKVALIYAWNEYGEGAYLTPTKSGFNPSLGMQKIIKKR